MTESIGALLAAYRGGTLDPSAVAADVLARTAASDAPVWIARVPDDELQAAAIRLDHADRSLPLYGVPFAVKDNIDVAGMETTAGCPGLARTATDTAAVVQSLLDAGALLVGKTNMDQLATGLVGTRTPYGACASVYDAERVSGGSSSGSAVAVALGHVAFALGTDTAGSGRVPAAFNGLVGVKPTRGLLSNRGVLPACASLDCVSVLARDVGGAAAVLGVAAAFDPEDPWSRRAERPVTPRHGRLAVPRSGQLALAEPAAAAAWEAALVHAGERWTLVEVDAEPLLAAAPLLYAAWVAERTADLGELVASGPEGLDPIVARIITGARERTAVETFSAMHRLAALRRAAEPIWEAADALLFPTTPGHPTHAEVVADPVGVNERLGRFTNFVNLLDLAALALPGPARPDCLPFGLTLLAPAFHDRRLLDLGARWSGEDALEPERGAVHLAVVGAHGAGLPLNHQLTGRGGRLVRTTRTAPCYRLYALPGDGLPRPGLVRAAAGGAALATEVWELEPAALGTLLLEIPAPLGLGRVRLEDGEEAIGFLCEAVAAEGAHDITAHGGWRAYLEAA